MRSPTTTIILSEMILAAMLTGCTGTDEYAAAPPVRTAGDDSLQPASYSESSPVTFTDEEALRYDTGPMDEDAPTEFQTTDSGLRYRILRKSDGKKPAANSQVTVNYRGWLDNGKEFDASYGGAPFSTPLNRVIGGWTEGMQLVGEGGMIELWIPARLGYGASGQGSIPPNATLHFIVEMLEVR